MPRKRGPTPEGGHRSRASRGAPVGDPAGHLRRSGDGPDREAGHRVRRFRTSACRRSAPSFFKGAEKDEGAPALATGPAERWLRRETKTARRGSSSAAIPRERLAMELKRFLNGVFGHE